MTASELSKKAKITPANLSKIINGKSSPKMETLHKLADALCVDVLELVKPNEKPNAIYIKRGENFVAIGEISKDILTLTK